MKTHLHFVSVDENLSGERRRGILSGLEPNTNYLLKVSAKNEAGRTEVTFSVTTRGFLRKFDLCVTSLRD